MRRLLAGGAVAVVATVMAVVASAAPSAADIHVKTKGGETCGVIPYEIELVVIVGSC